MPADNDSFSADPAVDLTVAFVPLSTSNEGLDAPGISLSSVSYSVICFETKKYNINMVY